jgi:taurine dioxygenase
MAVHPVVRVHPVTGRRSLFVNEHFTRRIVELSHGESDMLLRYLTRWVTSPRFTVRYRWTTGTIALWDNRCTQHYVLDDFDEERIIQRVTVMGDQPAPARPPRWEPYVKSGAPAAAGRHDRQLAAFLEQRRSGAPADRRKVN